MNRNNKSDVQFAKSLWMVKRVPYFLLIWAILLFLAMNVRLWVFEFIASYTHQLLIWAITALMILGMFIAWRLFVYGFKDTKYEVGKSSWISLIIAVVLFSISYLESISLVSPVLIHDDRASNFKVTTFNKLYRNQSFESDISQIIIEDPDVFTVQEISVFDAKYIKDLGLYEYYYLTDCGCSAQDTEISVFSHHPIVWAEPIYEHQDSVILRTIIDTGGSQGQVAFYAVHMHVPYSQSAYRLRDDAFQILSDNVDREDIPVFVAGDFNTSIYSPDMRDFMNDNLGIKMAASGLWPKCSWFGFGELACSRIDHVFVPKDSDLLGLRIGSQNGSDHRSVTAELRIN